MWRPPLSRSSWCLATNFIHVLASMLLTIRTAVSIRHFSRLRFSTGLSYTSVFIKPQKEKKIQGCKIWRPRWPWDWPSTSDPTARDYLRLKPKWGVPLPAERWVQAVCVLYVGRQTEQAFPRRCCKKNSNSVKLQEKERQKHEIFALYF